MAKAQFNWKKEIIVIELIPILNITPRKVYE